MLILYKYALLLLTPVLKFYLARRVVEGKEIESRLNERYGETSVKQPDGHLIWIHAASVGELQSAFILIEKLQSDGIQFLVTSGTVTSAKTFENQKPDNAIHQFIPLDHPKWVKAFLNHWKPDLALWLESEIWPNLLLETEKQKIPVLLINAKLSDRSYEHWKNFKSVSKRLFKIFALVITQSKKDKVRFDVLGGKTILGNNIKFNAAPLTYDQKDYDSLSKAIEERPIWVYASTHNGEEELASRLHRRLQNDIKGLLTFIVPRHPDRSDSIERTIKMMGFEVQTRDAEKNLPSDITEIYLCNTLGELGLFYTLSDIAMIGRSFSHDGGGGHNPIEAAQQDCIILTGPDIQFQHSLFDPMIDQGAAKILQKEDDLYNELFRLFTDKRYREQQIDKTKRFIQNNDETIDYVIDRITPYLPSKPKKAA